MRILLLAGTSDARKIAGELGALEGVDLLASLSGATRHPLDLPCKTRVGGFGGAAGLRQFLRVERIQMLIDATHPFADVMSKTAANVCAELKLPHIQMLRPAWHAQPGDNWLEIAREADLAQHVAKEATIFLATGRQTLEKFGNLTGRRLICRQIDPPDTAFPFANGQFLVGRPPFSIAEEVDLFTKLKIDWLVVKNSGAKASSSKLDAARSLGINVAMIMRPKQPDCHCVSHVSEVISWVKNAL